MFIYQAGGLLIGVWPTPLKNDGVKVRLDQKNPTIGENIRKMFQTTKQINGC